jgi:YHS domain-containing protein
MRQSITILFLTISITLFGQNTNTKKGFMAKGYDVVSYFDKKVKKGTKDFVVEVDDVKYQFSSKENLNLFKDNPKKYIPQYGGYCAYAIGAKGEKVDINPDTFEVRDGKLYLFYNSWGVNTLKLWKKEGALGLKEKADKNWKKIIKN